MAKKRHKQTPSDLPGFFYQRNGRYWWKAQLPGDDKPEARPLKPVGAKYATTDLYVAAEVAKNLYQEHIYATATDIPLGQAETLASLAAAYLHFCKQYYLDADGKTTKEAQEIGYSLKPLTELFANRGVNEFGPLRLIEVRDRMIHDRDWSRTLINHRIGRIKRMFKWAVSRQMVSPIVYQGLLTVEGLKRGRTTARENPKRKPVDDKYVYAILPYTTPVVATMVELQLLTGMRPGEMVLIRPCDIDRSNEAVWHYTPEKHKNAYRNIERIVSIGPRGQELLTPYLLRP
ncbi:MAG: hypothetical protein DRP52_04570, partial [Planctomycetota bacterium]